MNRAIILFVSTIFLATGLVSAQHSVARQWNEALLDAIRNDFARPPVHARNLFHTSVAMYDAWAVYEDDHETFFLAKTVDGFFCPFDGIPVTSDLQSSQEEAMSYAAYRLLSHRFQNSPGAAATLQKFDSLMLALGYDPAFASIDYGSGSAAALGNYLAEQLIAFGFQDRSNEASDYANQYYRPANQAFAPTEPGNEPLRFPNNWQPIAFDVFIDQAGNPIPINTPEFQSPEWGQVSPFALTAEDLTIYQRQGFDYWVYYDPGVPSLFDSDNPFSTASEAYKWGFSLVALWAAHLDPADGVMIDISPASIGNLPVDQFPTTLEEYQQFYDWLEGGDPSQGHAVNPTTEQPYAPQIVPRGDYARVLAEFWADGPDSETPPGHWFTILNYVSDHPSLEKRWRGEGEVLSDLEWDVKTYLALGGAVHDAAIAAWGIKGWYDYVRPISAIRYMATQGQSSDSTLMSYNPNGIPLLDSYVELVEAGDPLAGENNEHVGKIKLYTWRGPDYIEDPETDIAGVGWILGENWWPYQRPTFITPPFAGYVSGHSTFSRAAAEVLTYVTGDPYFPGGLGEFAVAKNEFLVFEEGPSVDFTLQWATYRDASDQTSLSRIWGGIHPPIDDIPGRLIGETVGLAAVQKADSYFSETVSAVDERHSKATQVYPNPVLQGAAVVVESRVPIRQISLLDVTGRVVYQQPFPSVRSRVTLLTSNVPPGMYLMQVTSSSGSFISKLIVQDR